MGAKELLAERVAAIGAALEVKEGADFERRVMRRMVGLGMTVECSRCGGCGRYSFNQIDGDRCYGCNGIGKKCVKIDGKAVKAAEAAKAEGRVTVYLAEVAAKKAAKALIAPLVAEIKAAIEPLGAAYDVAFKADKVVVGQGIYALWTRAADCYYGNQNGGPRGASATAVESAIRYGEYDAEVGLAFAVEILRERLAEAKACVGELATLG